MDVEYGGASFHNHFHFLLFSLFFQLSIVTYLVRISKNRKRGWEIATIGEHRKEEGLDVECGGVSLLLRLAATGRRQ